MATLKELAKELKVSVSTVSKALHDSPEISVSTIEKVKELAKKRNYKPNKIALSLKSNRTLTIGVVIPDILNRFYSKVLDGIHDSADKHGYDVITITTKESIIKEIDSLQILSTGNVDGVIIAMSEETLNKNDFSHIKEFTMKDTPIVMFDRVTDKINCDKVVIDDFDAIYNEVKSLKELGRKRIEKLIQKIGIFRIKAKSIYLMSKQVLEKHKGKVPKTFEELEKLPGVGHKTASVVMSQGFGYPAFAVDTHIHRLAQRWGLTNGKNVIQTEKDLKRIFPKKTWSKLHLQIIFYGREYCKARDCYGLTCKICTTCYPNRKKPVITQKA